MNNSEPRILILTLYSGENELQECIASLKVQTFKNFKHEIISGLENREAHDTLYKRCMQSSKDYDYFLKLDADMVLSSPLALDYIVKCAINNPNADLLSFTVFDYYTQSPIWGINIFSNRAKWTSIEEDLFVDEKPVFPGSKIKVKDWPEPHILHSPNPSYYQAFVFGIHRALKIVQHDRNTILIGHSYIQLKTIKSLYIHFKKSKDLRLAYALSGALFVFKNIIHKNVLTKKDEYYSEFHSVEKTIDNLNELNFYRFFNFIYLIKWAKIIGYRRFMRGVYNYIKRKCI
ncbi:MAG: glycosyltransferase family 2 protein [Crenarchaeota archaeon]|nr:glycosyltransferase family 2 protein [Thermoproteota archaeon]